MLLGTAAHYTTGREKGLIAFACYLSSKIFSTSIPLKLRNLAQLATLLLTKEPDWMQKKWKCYYF